MRRALAALRLFLFGLLLLGGLCLVLLSTLVPSWRGDVPLSFRVVSVLARLALRLFAVKVSCNRPEAIRDFHGLLFANHVSYLDIPVLLFYTPLRFLAKAEVAGYPLVGQIARAVGTVFVQRSDKESRRQARQRLVEVDMSVPLVIFVEGGTGPGGRLLPFRYGAFEIAILTGNPFLPCAIIHEQEGLVVRHQNEPLLRSIWRLGKHTGLARVHLEVIDPVQPKPDDDARLLALETQAAMSELLPYPARAE